MMLASVAVAAFTLGLAAEPKPATVVATVFAAYCKIPIEGGQPYCAEAVPENVQWLVLYSLCSAKDRDASYTPVCDAFGKDVLPNDTAARKFLNYDPRFDRWAAAAFKTATGGKCDKGMADALGWYCRSAASDWLDIDETGLATVTRAASDDIPIVIVGVNPLLYKTTPEAVTSEDIASLQALQTIALGLGGVLQSSIGIFARGKRDPRVLFTMSIKRPLFEFPDPVKPEPVALTTVLELRDEVLQRMADASKRLANQANAADIARSQAIVAIQDAEQKMARTGATLTLKLLQADSAGVTYAGLQAAYADLDTTYRAVRDFGEPCRPLLKDFLFIIQHAKDAPAALRPRLNAFLTAHRTHPQCVSPFDALAQQVVGDAQTLADIASDAAFRTAIADQNTIYNAGLELIVSPPPKAEGAAEKDPAPLEAAVDLLTAKRNAALSVYNSLVTAGMRRQDYTFADALMMTWLYVTPRTDQLPWSKVQTHAFSLKRNAPLSGSVTGALADDTALKYKLQSNKATGIGVGLGVFYTKLSEPTFEAVTNPANKEEKVVSQTDTSTLAGQLALFADWRFLSLADSSAERWFLRPSLQVGTNVSTTPGFFVGFGADLFKYFRFGWGRTFQRSKRLGASQTLDTTVIGSGTDIKTEDFFAKGQYFSFSFALDSLPLFKKGDSGGGSSTKEKAK